MESKAWVDPKQPEHLSYKAQSLSDALDGKRPLMSKGGRKVILFYDKACPFAGKAPKEAILNFGRKFLPISPCPSDLAACDQIAVQIVAACLAYQRFTKIKDMWKRYDDCFVTKP